MKYIMTIWKVIRMTAIGIWDFIFFFFGMPYEEQSKKFKLDKHDKAIRGPKNPKSKKTFYRANKVGSKEKD